MSGSLKLPPVSDSSSSSELGLGGYSSFKTSSSFSLPKLLSFYLYSASFYSNFFWRFWFFKIRSASEVLSLRSSCWTEISARSSVIMISFWAITASCLLLLVILSSTLFFSLDIWSSSYEIILSLRKTSWAISLYFSKVSVFSLFLSTVPSFVTQFSLSSSLLVYDSDSDSLFSSYVYILNFNYVICNFNSYISFFYALIICLSAVVTYFNFCNCV